MEYPLLLPTMINKQVQEGKARMEEGNKLSSWATGMQSRSEMMYRYGNDAATRCLNAKKQKLKLNYHHAK
jgi:hypothetical protein